MRSLKKKQQYIYSVDDEEHSSTNLEFLIPHDLVDGFVNNKNETYRFKFHKVFDQEPNRRTSFENIATPMADSVLSGCNGTIFAYGQTASGKTFTITGGAERYSDRGMTPHTLCFSLLLLEQDSTKVYTTHISYLEIYNLCGYDLLDPRHEASRLEDLPKVFIIEDPEQNIHLKNLSSHQAANEEEAHDLLFLRDTKNQTPMNQASSRSCCIFTIHVSGRELGSATVWHSKLHLVDLAGSERVGKTGGGGGQLLTEVKYINLSLHYLEQYFFSCVPPALSEKNRSHIPYQNSMMTSVLWDSHSLGGNCMTTLITTLSMKRNIDVSISTCRFTQRVAQIMNEVVLTEELDPRLMITQLKREREIQALKDKFAMVTREQRTDQLTAPKVILLEERMEAFMEDSDPDAALDVGAVMCKIQHCFHKRKGDSSVAVVPSASDLRAPGKLVSPVPLTGDQQTDSDILAFAQARQNLLQRKGATTELSEESKKRMGHGAAVVLHLSQRISDPNHKLYFDNYFTTYNVIEVLTDKRIHAAETARICRFANPPLKSDKEMSKKEREEDEVERWDKKE
ncbi:kinesin-like protein KIF6 [Acipenser ruthenus]|uniref:kinesin-like protein KIF6 n=1 Tax=Acipenser ruthenus TaxID=7906 RepID=UPI00274072AF|nr:kinesin-like protein KIF6 [Acipenser ruthenus]